MRLKLPPLVWLLSLTVAVAVSHAQTEPTSASIIGYVLEGVGNQDELTRLNSGLTELLADERLTNQATRQRLQESRIALAEMRNQKTGANAEKLIDLAKWLRAQGEEQLAIRDAGGTPSPQQQLVLDNPLAGGGIHLIALLHEILGVHLEIDRENAGAAKLEALFQLYLNFGPALERSWWLVDSFLLYAPQWTRTRFPQLTAEQKREFLKDANDARAERAAGPGADEEPGPPPTPQEQAAYEAAYQFIVNNTPPP